MNFNDVYDTGRVRRFHTLPDYSGGAAQSVAEHSWGVALLVCELCRRIGEIPNAALLLTALLHDAEEVYTGDTPATAKWRWPGLARELNLATAEVQKELRITTDLTDRELWILKWADSLELYVYAQRRVRDGARSYAPVVDNIYRYMTKELIGASCIEELLSELTWTGRLE